jgi:hypothetical protein
MGFAALRRHWICHDLVLNFCLPVLIYPSQKSISYTHVTDLASQYTQKLSFPILLRYLAANRRQKIRMLVLISCFFPLPAADALLFGPPDLCPVCKQLVAQCSFFPLEVGCYSPSPNSANSFSFAFNASLIRSASLCNISLLSNFALSFSLCASLEPRIPLCAGLAG